MSRVCRCQEFHWRRTPSSVLVLYGLEVDAYLFISESGVDETAESIRPQTLFSVSHIVFGRTGQWQAPENIAH